MEIKKEAGNSEREIVQTRLLDAPRELVWEAWTDPSHLINWWGPTGFSNTFHEISIRPGGTWRFIMHGPDGRNYPNKIEFIEVVKPERLVFRHMDDPDTEPVNHQTIVTFEEKGDKTLLTMALLFVDKDARDFVVREYGAIEGGKQTLDKLEAELKLMSV